jgi:hypothetical protein
MTFALPSDDGSMTVTIRRDPTERKVHVDHSADCEPYLDANKAAQAEPQKFAGSFRRVASIPPIIILKWMNEHGVNWFRMPKAEKAKFIARKLNDPDYRYLKTIPGRV